jgi:conjugative relaxase-like TrwC/TraI family protein
MLTIATLTSAQAATSYLFRDAYACGDTDGPIGWWGVGADLLGLSGPVDVTILAHVLNGSLPNGVDIAGSRIGAAPPTLGWDLVWSAPKSVSVMALVQGDTRLIEAHDKAVRGAMEDVEALQTHASLSDVGEGKLRQTDNLLAALFRHGVNWKLQPRLHTHALVANATETDDGRWRGIERQPIMASIKDSGAIYRSFLAAEVTRLGYQIVVGANFTFEIAGVARALTNCAHARSAHVKTCQADRRPIPDPAIFTKRHYLNRRCWGPSC